MFIVLAVGTLMDTSQPAYNLEAEKYNQLARAALFQESFFDTPTVHAVQALVCLNPLDESPSVGSVADFLAFVFLRLKHYSLSY
jgi:hypothetical protein